MKKIKITRYVVFLLWISLMVTGCYKEEHYSFPGPYENDDEAPVDSLPFPFDKNKEAGVWLMKDGVPDYSKILFKGYTDYYAKGDTLSWVTRPDGLHMVPHYNYYPLSNADHFAGDVNCYKYNWAYSKYFVPMGAGKSFYFYAKVTFGTLNGTAAGMVMGKSWDTGGTFLFGMDGNSTSGEPLFFIDLYGTLGGSVDPDLGWPTVAQVLIPGVPADMEVVIHDELFYAKINGTLVFSFKLPHEQNFFFTPQVRPWRNFISVHDMYIESSEMYTIDHAMHQQEQGYNKIQAPALARAANGNLLLFAEGRSNPASAKERVAQNTIPVGDCDIIMKRSIDGGMTWDDQIQVIAGASESSTFCYPQVITTTDGKIILQYSVISGSFNKNTYVYDKNSQHIYLTESSDNGTTWSSPVEITSSVKDVAGYIKNGNAHGIELQSGAYSKRLLMPLTYSNNSIRVAISDDQGQTWRLSKAVGGSKLQYGSIVELNDGRIMMISGHANTSPKNKMVSYSTDGGENWSAAKNIAADVATGSYGQLYPGVVLKGRNNEILFVNSTNRESDPETKNSPNYPVTPVMFTSTDDGLTFASSSPLFMREAYTGYNAPFGFMDAVVLDDGSVVIAGEGGVESPAEGIVIYRK